MRRLARNFLLRNGCCLAFIFCFANTMTALFLLNSLLVVVHTVVCVYVMDWLVDINVISM